MQAYRSLALSAHRTHANPHSPFSCLFPLRVSISLPRRPHPHTVLPSLLPLHLSLPPFFRVTPCASFSPAFSSLPPSPRPNRSRISSSLTPPPPAAFSPSALCVISSFAEGSNAGLPLACPQRPQPPISSSLPPSIPCCFSK